MTPKQRKQLAAILLKEGDDGWRIERKHIRNGEPWLNIDSEHLIDCYQFQYRAVRIERIPTRTPLPIEHYKRGMEVRLAAILTPYLVLGQLSPAILTCSRIDTSSVGLPVLDVAQWRWPNETEWHPAYTETIEEREVDRLEVEGL